MAPHAPDWQEWYDLHAPRLLLYARQWLLERSDAEDAVQAGFVKFWRHRSRPATSDVPLLFAAVRTAALDLAKARRRQIGRETRAAADAPTAWWDTDSLSDRERVAAIQQAIATLPAGQREAVVLKIWGGFTFAEVASAVGANMNTVASRYRMALATLRNQLVEACHETER